MPGFRGYFAILFVKDLELARDFYENKIGFTFDKGDERSAGFFTGDDFLLLFNHDGADEMLAAGGVDHGQPPVREACSWRRSEDVDAAYKALRSCGVEFLALPRMKSWGVRLRLFQGPRWQRLGSSTSPHSPWRRRVHRPAFPWHPRSGGQRGWRRHLRAALPDDPNEAGAESRTRWDNPQSQAGQPTA